MRNNLLVITQKLSTSAAGGSYVQGHYYPPTQGGMFPNAMMPLYPMYHYHLHSQPMGGLHAHIFPPTTTTSPAIISKPTPAMPASTGNLSARPHSHFQQSTPVVSILITSHCWCFCLHGSGTGDRVQLKERSLKHKTET